MASIKLNRATKLANKLPAAEVEILASIPAELDCLDAHWHRAVRFCTQRIVEEGCVWDGEQLREISPKA